MPNFFTEMNTETLVNHINVVHDYDHALARIDARHRQTDIPVNPRCTDKLLTHGRQTEQAIVFLHGFTNCPEQFSALGDVFYKRGYNVYIPRFPHHGLTDRLTTMQEALLAQELVDLIGHAVDVAHGLGKRVTIAGLSAGGVLAAWAAQYRADVDHAVLIAPSFGFRVIPAGLTFFLMNVVAKLGNIYVWWDPRYKNNLAPEHAYARYSSHALAEVVRMGAAVLKSARQKPPLAHRVTLVSNAADLAVNNALIARLARYWQKHQATPLHTYQFPLSMGIIHDMVDPGQEMAKIDITYPILIDLIEGKTPNST